MHGLLKKSVWFISASLILLSSSIPVFAAEKIGTIKVSISFDGYEDGEAVFEAETNANHYSVEGFEMVDGFLDTGSGPGKMGREDNLKDAKTIPVYEVTLSADDNYYFDVMTEEDIKISGYGAVCSKAVRKDLGTTLVLTVELEEIDKLLGKVQEIHLKDGIVSWEPAGNAAVYEVYVYLNEKLLGTMRETASNEMDLRSMMLWPGSYKVMVFSKTATGNKRSSKAVSECVVVSETQAETFKQIFGEAGVSGWIETEGRWRYRLEDGSYLQGEWLQEEASWYYFDSKGNMVTDEWIFWKRVPYYMGADGKLQET